MNQLRIDQLKFIKNRQGLLYFIGMGSKIKMTLLTDNGIFYSKSWNEVVVSSSIAIVGERGTTLKFVPLAHTHTETMECLYQTHYGSVLRKKMLAKINFILWFENRK